MLQQEHTAASNVDFAFRYHFASTCLERGYSVIPVNGKTPAVPWKRFHSSRPTLDLIRRWFGTKTSVAHNLGIVTGRISDLIVVDIDSEIDAEYWRDNCPETPIVVETGGGGMHFYYRYPTIETMGNRVRVLQRSIDIRGDGGMVVAPPSVHPESGRPYRWLNPFEEYRLDDVPHFDVRWIAQCDVFSLGTKSSATKARGHIRNARSYVRSIDAVSGDCGHNKTFRVACILRDAGMSPEEVLTELEDWSAQHAFPPWSARELEHKVRSVFAEAHTDGQTRKQSKT